MIDETTTIAKVEPNLSSNENLNEIEAIVQIDVQSSFENLVSGTVDYSNLFEQTPASYQIETNIQPNYDSINNNLFSSTADSANLLK